MKNQAISFLRITAIFFLAGLWYSCDQKGDNVQSTDEITSETTIPLNTENHEGLNEPMDTHNAVKVPINANDNLNWEEFKGKFHHTSEGPEDFPSEVAIGPWITLEAYEYRRVYRLENNNLWIQTYFRNSNTSTEIDVNAIPKALTLQESETNGLGSVWNDMIERGIFLSDSLGN